MGDEAVLSSDGVYTSFAYGGRLIRFMTSPQLRRYKQVLKWDNGYLVVRADYCNSGEEEDYIDLVPVLKNLNIDPLSFLRNIKRVRIAYE